ncbi:MAG: hypothetical protein ICV63_18350 [Coleofasciculus sp. Co-bin14]|nr:hypothetical protein [Coleofasciculus sp. Co-bin14]
MLSTPHPEARAIHRLARFVTKEALALLLNLKPHEIYRIDCWRHVIHVVGKGVSTFVSYADIPPILDVEPPAQEDFACWRKRWKKNKYKAPKFWEEFYKQKFKLALSLPEMYKWGELVSAIKFALSEAAVQLLRSVYQQERYWMDKF